MPALTGLGRKGSLRCYRYSGPNGPLNTHRSVRLWGVGTTLPRASCARIERWVSWRRRSRVSTGNAVIENRKIAGLTPTSSHWLILWIQAQLHSMDYLVEAIRWSRETNTAPRFTGRRLWSLVIDREHVEARD